MYPETETCLVCLTFECVQALISLEVLKQLVTKSCLKKLRVGQHGLVEKIHCLMDSVTCPCVLFVGVCPC